MKNMVPKLCLLRLANSITVAHLKLKASDGKRKSFFADEQTNDEDLFSGICILLSQCFS